MRLLVLNRSNYYSDLTNDTTYEINVNVYLIAAGCVIVIDFLKMRKISTFLFLYNLFKVLSFFVDVSLDLNLVLYSMNRIRVCTNAQIFGLFEGIEKTTHLRKQNTLHKSIVYYINSSVIVRFFTSHTRSLLCR